jgi:hypothetical protein
LPTTVPNHVQRQTAVGSAYLVNRTLLGSSSHLTFLFLFTRSSHCFLIVCLAHTSFLSFHRNICLTFAYNNTLALTSNLPIAPTPFQKNNIEINWVVLYPGLLFIPSAELSRGFTSVDTPYRYHLLEFCRLPRSPYTLSVEFLLAAYL